MFLSSYESSVDAKKRVSIPASYRRALGGEEVFIWPSMDKPCLEGGGAMLVERFQKAIGRLKPLDPRREALAYAIFGRGRHCKLDDGGRIVLDQDFLEFAGVGDRARFVGLGDRFQIWAPEAHQPRAEDLLRLAAESGDLLDPFDDGAAAA
jgi:MraZ protein